jgi:pimeloyl-ACP methyl ester carboxylesterase
MRYRYQCSSFFLFFIFFTGCGGGSSTKNVPATAGDLVSISKLSMRSIEEIGTFLSTATTLVSPRYFVDNYKIIYKTTDTNGNLVDVSGVLAIPKKGIGISSPRLSLHHGTIVENKDAPSFNHQAFSPSVIAASLGYIVTEADYIGYGESIDQLHPYMQKETLSGAAIDLLRASQTWLMQQNISQNKQLFLGGYSEGGYTTLAVQKRIQEELANEFTVTASVPAESAYNLTLTSKIQPDDEVYTFIFYAYMMKAYDEIYALDLLSNAIRSEYFTIVNTYFDATHSFEDVVKQLPALNSSADSFFKREFLQQYNNGEITALSERFAENDLHDWIPTAPTRFYHGREDRIVPFEPVEKLVQTMQSKGAPDVRFVECNAGGDATTHQNCFFPAMLYSIGFFAQYATDL